MIVYVQQLSVVVGGGGEIGEVEGGRRARTGMSLTSPT